jgi:hypothetical protein
MIRQTLSVAKRHFYKVLPVLFVALTLSGCVKVEQKDNKIYTNLEYGVVYDFSKKVISDLGYTVVSEDKTSGKIETVVSSNSILYPYKEPPAKINLAISEKKDLKQVVVDITALMEGDKVDEKKGAEVAKAAIAQIKNELGLYSAPFEAKESGKTSITFVSAEKLSTYLQNSLPSKGYKIDDTTNGLTVSSISPNHPFNKPAKVVFAFTSAADNTDVALDVSISGIYNQPVTSTLAKQILNEMIVHIGEYPLVRQNQSVSFLYSKPNDVKKLAKGVIAELGYSITSEDGLNIVATKEDLTLQAQIVDNGTESQVQLIGMAEGTPNQSKAEVSAVVIDKLNELSAALSANQYVYTSSKLIANVGRGEITNYVKKVLVKNGYGNITVDPKTYTVQANKVGNPAQKVVVVANSIGTDGTTVDVYGIVNKKNTDEPTKAKVSKDVENILKGLAVYDKQNIK